MPLTTAPPAWLAPGVALRVTETPRTSGPVALVRVAPGPEIVVARADGIADTPVELVAAPGPAGLYRFVLRSTAEPDAPFALRVRPVTLAAIGDVSPGSAIAAVRAHGPSWHWSIVGRWLRSRDIVVANLETAVGRSGRPWPDKPFHFLSPPATIAAAARRGGVDVVSVANNHALDYGRATFASGLQKIRRAGIVPFGGGNDLEGALAPAIVERGGLRIAFVGFDGYQPFDFWATAARAGNGPATAAAIRHAVAAARARADLVVAYFHWGVELERRPTRTQRRLARIAFAAGATVILGAHPHVLQAVERRSRHRLIAWSLGNFVFAPGSAVATVSGALSLELDASGVARQTLRPVRIIETRPRWTRG